MSNPAIFVIFYDCLLSLLKLQFREAIIFLLLRCPDDGLNSESFNKNKDWQTVGFEPHSTPGSQHLFTVQVTIDITLAHLSVASEKCNSTVK